MLDRVHPQPNPQRFSDLYRNNDHHQRMQMQKNIPPLNADECVMCNPITPDLSAFLGPIRNASLTDRGID